MSPSERERRGRIGYLAGQALTGILASPELAVSIGEFGKVVDLAHAYAVALERRVEITPLED